MDTKLVAIFILSGILGAIIVVTGCIKVLGKNGELNLKTAGFILAGFIFVALPVLGTVSFEWGEFKLLISTTNKQVKEIQESIDSLRSGNEVLIEDLINLQTNMTDYGQVMLNPHKSVTEKTEFTRQVQGEISRLSTELRAQNVILKKTKIKSDSVVDKLNRSATRLKR
jgi:preprotein translocase subunit YajC